MLKLHHVKQLILGKGVGADDVDVADARGLAFLDVDADGHPIAGQLLHLGVDGGAVAALGDVLALKLQTDPLQGRLLEYLALAQALLGEPLQQRIGLDGLVALDLNGLDGGPLDHGHHQHAAVPGHADVVEVAGGEQQANQLADGHFIDPVADVDRQRVEHRARGDPLQPLQADVGDGEGVGADRRGGAQGHR